MKAITIVCLGLLIFSKASAEFREPFEKDIKSKFCKNIEAQTTMLMNTYNSNEEQIIIGDSGSNNESVRIRSISLTNLNFMANIWSAFCGKITKLN